TLTFRVRDSRGTETQISAFTSVKERAVIATLTNGGTMLQLSTLAELAPHWTKPAMDKIINIPAAEIRGASSGGNTAIRIGTPWAGNVVLNVDGEIQGAGGAQNGGKGGNALDINTAGINGEKLVINQSSTGKILAGGGGGGRGGKGGDGQTTNTVR